MSSLAPPSLTHALPGPETVREVHLPNGMQALIRENHASPTVVIGGAVRGGALYEPPDRCGLAAFTASMLERGTTERTFSELSEDLEAIGAEIGFAAGRYTIGFDAKCLAEDLPHVLARLAEMISRPAFPEVQVERLRGQILTSIHQRDNNTGQRAAQAFSETAYGPDHPFGRQAGGTTESIAAISRDELATYYERLVRPENGSVVLVGAVPVAAAAAILGETVGAWQPAGEGPPPPAVAEPLPLPERREARVELPGKTQTDIVLGNPAISRRHPDWLPASLANIVLGVFGLMGRLGENVRDRRGLAYYAHSRLAGGLGPGPWFAAAGVNPANVDEAIDAILAEMYRLRDEPVSEEELADVRAFVTGSLPLRLETNAGVVRSLLDIALYDLGLDYLQRFGELVAAVTPSDVQRAARAYLHPDRAAVGIAGPLADARS